MREDKGSGGGGEEERVMETKRREWRAFYTPQGHQCGFGAIGERLDLRCHQHSPHNVTNATRLCPATSPVMEREPELFAIGMISVVDFDHLGDKHDARRRESS